MGSAIVNVFVTRLCELEAELMKEKGFAERGCEKVVVGRRGSGKGSAVEILEMSGVHAAKLSSKRLLVSGGSPYPKVHRPDRWGFASKAPPP